MMGLPDGLNRATVPLPRPILVRREEEAVPPRGEGQLHEVRGRHFQHPGKDKRPSCHGEIPQPVLHHPTHLQQAIVAGQVSQLNKTFLFGVAIFWKNLIPHYV